MIKVSEKIRELILTNNDFSLKLAQALQVTQQSVVSLAKRNSVKLTLYAAILLYKEEGFTDEEIFEDAYKKVGNELWFNSTERHNKAKTFSKKIIRGLQ